MKTLLKHYFYGALHGTGLTALMRTLHQKHVPVLIYHGVTDQEHNAALDIERIHMAQEDFKQQLAFIARHYTVISLNRYIEALNGGAPLPSKSLVLTFDDGYENNYSIVYPLLKRYQMPATFYISADFIAEGRMLWVDRLKCAVSASPLKTWKDTATGIVHSLNSPAQRGTAYLALNRLLKKLPANEQESSLQRIEKELLLGKHAPTPSLFKPMTKDQVRELASSSLIEIGSHTCRHKLLTKLSSQEVQQELQKSKQIIEELIGKPVHAFSYPNGDFNRDVLKAVAAAGYTSAVAGGLCLNPPQGVNPYAIARVALAEGDSEALIAATLSGVREALIALKGHPQMEQLRRYG